MYTINEIYCHFSLQLSHTMIEVCAYWLYDIDRPVAPNIHQMALGRLLLIELHN